jgi:hypothetical protein
MNLLRIILHAALVPTLFVVAQSASAAVNPAPLDSPAAQAPSDRAASDKKRRLRDRSAASAVAEGRRSTEAGPHPDESKDTGKGQQGKGQAARANSDRVRSLLNKQATRTRTAVTASRHGAAPTAGASRSAAGGGGATRGSGDPGPVAANSASPSQGRANPSQARTNLLQGPASAMPNRAAPRAAVALPQNSAARTGTLGGSRAQEHGRLGGPSSGKSAHAAALDGTQLQRRKY